MSADVPIRLRELLVSVSEVSTLASALIGRSSAWRQVLEHVAAHRDEVLVEERR